MYEDEDTSSDKMLVHMIFFNYAESQSSSALFEKMTIPHTIFTKQLKTIGYTTIEPVKLLFIIEPEQKVKFNLMHFISFVSQMEF